MSICFDEIDEERACIELSPESYLLNVIREMREVRKHMNTLPKNPTVRLKIAKMNITIKKFEKMLKENARERITQADKDTVESLLS